MGRLSNLFSAETIAWQSDVLFVGLTNLVAELRKGRSYGDTIVSRSGIPELVFKHTGIKIKLKITHDPSVGAWTMLPQLDRNHVFFQESIRHWVGCEGIVLINKAGAPLRGAVDLVNCKVSGIFSEIEVEVGLTSGLLNSQSYESAEIAAIMLHEIGHDFTYFEHLGTTVRTALISAAAAKACLGITEPVELRKILVATEKAANIEIADKDNLIQMTDKKLAQAVQVIVLSSAIHKTRAENGAAQYSMRACEQLADQFAIRHGAGSSLVTGLDKIFKQYGVSESFGTTAFVCIELLKVAVFVIYTIVLFGLPLILIWLFDPTGKIYDDPVQRITMAKQQLVDRLKDRKLDPALTARIVSDIAVITKCELELNDRRTFYELIWTTCIPSGRANYDQLRVQKEIEQLINNDLFVQASKFKLGATQ